jgi:hypothetical protein
MSDYTVTLDGATLDGANATVTGAAHDIELLAIRTALVSKYDVQDVATSKQAKDETTATRSLLTPRRLQSWSNANAGVLHDIRRIADVNPESVNAGTDLFPYWDDTLNSAKTLASFGQVQGASSDGIGSDSSAVIRLHLEDLTAMTETIDTAADLLLFYDTTGATMRRCSPEDLPTTGSTVNATIKHKTADQDKTADDTLADDTHLAGFSLDASSVYEVKVYALCSQGSATPDIKFRLQGDVAITSAGVEHRQQSTFGNNAGTASSTYNTTYTMLMSGTITDRYIAHMEAVIETSAALTLAFQWAQNTSDAGTVRVHNGSWMSVRKIS